MRLLCSHALSYCYNRTSSICCFISACFFFLKSMYFKKSSSSYSGPAEPSPLDPSLSTLLWLTIISGFCIREILCAIESGLLPKDFCLGDILWNSGWSSSDRSAVAGIEELLIERPSAPLIQKRLADPSMLINYLTALVFFLLTRSCPWKNYICFRLCYTSSFLVSGDCFYRLDGNCSGLNLL